MNDHDPRCPECRGLLDAATLVPERGDRRDVPVGEAMPHARSGDFSVCLYCGALLRFEGDPGAAWRYRTVGMAEVRRVGGSGLVRRMARVQRLARNRPN